MLPCRVLCRVLCRVRMKAEGTKRPDNQPHGADYLWRRLQVSSSSVELASRYKAQFFFQHVRMLRMHELVLHKRIFTCRCVCVRSQDQHSDVFPRLWSAELCWAHWHRYFRQVAARPVSCYLPYTDKRVKALMILTLISWRLLEIHFPLLEHVFTSPTILQQDLRPRGRYRYGSNNQRTFHDQVSSFMFVNLCPCWFYP